MNNNTQAWEAFLDTGLLWWVNRSLHIFGWAIVLTTELREGHHLILSAYPQRVKYRGFDQMTEEANFRKLTTYLSHEGPTLVDDLKS